MDKFYSHHRRDVLTILQDVSLKASGNTAFNGIIVTPISNGMEARLLESVTPYGVKLDIGKGGYYGKKDRRTGKLARGFFSYRGRNAAGDYLRGMGGYINNMNATRELVAIQAIDNPLRQQIYMKHIMESGDDNDTID